MKVVVASLPSHFPHPDEKAKWSFVVNDYVKQLLVF
jgi:hypothetical protein